MAAAFAWLLTAPVVAHGVGFLTPGFLGPLERADVEDLLLEAGGGGRPVHPHHVASLLLSADLVALEGAGHAGDLARAVALAKRASLGQAELLGEMPGSPVPLMGLGMPSEGLRELAARLGIELTGGEVAAMERLDALPEGIAWSLARFVDAFLALDMAARVDPGLLSRVGNWAGERAPFPEPGVVGGTWTDPPLPSKLGAWSDERLLVVDIGLLAATRVQFLEAILALHAALATLPMEERGCGPVQVPLVFSISLGDCDDVYTVPFVLQLDEGGNDWYDNNAGGSNIYGGYFCGLLPQVRAALVDLGAGSDTYGTPSRPRFCGVNGGAYIGGMGFLLDAGGSDFYVADLGGNNGGAYLASTGFLLDVDGNDRYSASGASSNGGGGDGVGMLIDTGGNDVYEGGAVTNGGASGFGRLRASGFLMDTSGHDVYSAHGTGAANGAGSTASGRGFLLDVEGDDVYLAREGPANGGGWHSSGAGFLLDLAGNDLYQAWYYGVNGGASLAGWGMLVDLAGDDVYAARFQGANGGGAGGGVGTLIDGGGDDIYSAEDDTSNGAGGLLVTALVDIPVGLGLLVDRGGVDTYRDALIDCVDCSLAPKGTIGAQVDK